MEGVMQPPPPAVEDSATVSKVLGDDNLFIEILLRVGLPTNLVRAALVCKRWLLHASDPSFLGLFRKMHPPRLLGFYINTGDKPRFIPMLPQPPEIAAIIDRTTFCPDTWQGATATVMDCRNGRVFSIFLDGPRIKHRVDSPLCTERGTASVPSTPMFRTLEGQFCIRPYLLSKEQGDDLSYFYVYIGSNKDSIKFTVQVYMLQNGVWCTQHTLVTDLPSTPPREPKPVLVDNKIYIASTKRNIIVMDLKASSFSTFCLPQGVEYGDGDTMLSRVNDASGVYLIQAKDLQLRIWLHKENSWQLVESIFMSEMVTNLRMSDGIYEDEHINVLRILQVGDNAEFVFFQMARCILHLDIKYRTLRKVYDLSQDEQGWGDVSINPFTMIGPTFPTLKCDPTRIAM